MKFKVHSDPWLPDTPVTRWLILLNASVWLTGLAGDVLGFAPLSTEGLLLRFALFPEQVAAMGTLWTPFTYMFLHGGAVHLIMNMLGLYLLGPDLEWVFRAKGFVFLYLLSGWVGGISYWVFSHLLLGQIHPVVGASGAIMGLLGAIVAIYPQRVYILLPLMIPLRAVTLAVLMVSVHLFFMITPYGGQVAYDVHLFGGLAGYGFAMAAATLHRRQWQSHLPNLDRERDAVELEALIVRMVRGDEPLSEAELERFHTLQKALRYEDVVTVEEAKSWSLG